MKYIKEVRLIAAGGVFEDLKISFNVEKTLTGVANSALIKISNLNDASRANLNREFNPITLEAGYQGLGNIGTIFTGFIRDVTHDRIGADVVTFIDAGDGDNAFRKSFISKTYREGMTIRDIVIDVQSEMTGVDLGELKFPDDISPIRFPMSFMGTPQRVLDELGRSYGFYWSVQNGALEVIPGQKFLRDVEDVTPKTGLIGVPTITDAGVIARYMLDPEIRPNRKINVQSETTDREGRSGEHRISSVGYVGDNREGPFYCEIEAELINDGETVVR